MHVWLVLLVLLQWPPLSRLDLHVHHGYGSISLHLFTLLRRLLMVEVIGQLCVNSNLPNVPNVMR